MTLAARKIRLIMSLRRNGVHDTSVLDALERVPREAFVPPTFQDQAYEDTALPIGGGQTISQPLIVALMTQALEVRRGHKVLEIGTGSGYQAAVLCLLCRRLYSIERVAELQRDAEVRFLQLGLTNYTLRAGDGTRGWPEQAPFDRILATAAGLERPPPPLLDQLAPGGRLLIPLGRGRDQHVYRYDRTPAGEIVEERLWPVRFVPLIGEDAHAGPT